MCGFTKDTEFKTWQPMEAPVDYVSQNTETCLIKSTDILTNYL